MARSNRSPPERHATARSRLKEALLESTLTIAQLSRRAGLSEREIPDHLEHLEKSVRAEGAKLELLPARCVACDYQFTGRTRAKKPSRCPECSSERIDPPAFRIVRDA